MIGEAVALAFAFGRVDVAGRRMIGEAVALAFAFGRVDAGEAVALAFAFGRVDAAGRPKAILGAIAEVDGADKHDCLGRQTIRIA